MEAGQWVQGFGTSQEVPYNQIQANAYWISLTDAIIDPEVKLLLNNACATKIQIKPFIVQLGGNDTHIDIPESLHDQVMGAHVSAENSRLQKNLAIMVQCANLQLQMLPALLMSKHCSRCTLPEQHRLDFIYVMISIVECSLCRPDETVEIQE